MKRSKRKGPYQNIINSKKKFKFLSRNFEITSNVLGMTFSVHSGKKNSLLTISENMMGHKAGEFVFTREKFEFKKKKRK